MLWIHRESSQWGPPTITHFQRNLSSGSFPLFSPVRLHQNKCCIIRRLRNMQKAVNTVQYCSTEKQKGAIALGFVYSDNALLVLNGALSNSDYAFLALNWRIMGVRSGNRFSRFWIDQFSINVKVVKVWILIGNIAILMSLSPVISFLCFTNVTDFDLHWLHATVDKWMTFITVAM